MIINALVTIIVPVYNVERYLNECVDSLLCQTYTNLEIILVDDGATDRSGGICDLYVQKDCRVQVIHKKNAGLGMARNSGLDVAKGEFVVFVDSDDYVDDNYIEVLLEVLSEATDSVVAGFRKVHNGCVLFEDCLKTHTYEGKDVKNTFLPRLLGSSFVKHDSIKMSVWSVLYKRDIIERYELRFVSERIYISEDLMFNLSYFPLCKGVGVLANNIYNYRLTPNSLTTSYKPDRFEKIKFFYIEVEKKILTLFSESKKNAIRRFQRMFFIYIRSCIQQETRQSSSYFDQNTIKAISHICGDPLVQRICDEFPIEKLAVKQKAFALLVKCKCALVLYILFKLMN